MYGCKRISSLYPFIHIYIISVCIHIIVCCSTCVFSFFSFFFFFFAFDSNQPERYTQYTKFVCQNSYIFVLLDLVVRQLPVRSEVSTGLFMIIFIYFVFNDIENFEIKTISGFKLKRKEKEFFFENTNCHLHQKLHICSVNQNKLLKCFFFALFIYLFIMWKRNEQICLRKCNEHDNQ